MAQVFVNQKYHKTTGWVNNVQVKTGETIDEAVNLAKHQFHAFMSTYGYGVDNTIDYVACDVTDLDGLVLMGPEIDNRIEPEPEE